MCHTILRVTYTSSEKQDIEVRDGDEVENRILDLQARDTVTRIEEFIKANDLLRTTIWQRKPNKSELSPKSPAQLRAETIEIARQFDDSDDLQEPS